MGLPRGQGSQVLAEQDPAGSPWQCWPGLFPEVSPAPVPAVLVGTASSPRPLWNGGQAHALTQTRTHCTHRHTCTHSLHTVTHLHTLYRQSHTQHNLYTQSHMHSTLVTHTHFTHSHTHTAHSSHTIIHARILYPHPHSHTVTGSPLLRTNSHLQEHCRLNPYLGEIS